MKFQLKSPYQPKGDQPKAIQKLKSGLQAGLKYQTLLGVTGSGKTFTIAKLIESVQRPALIISHNKVLAAQLYREFKQFFPENAVHYFVSYYDYYQPEAYLPQTDTYIEKDAKINQEIDRLRHAATHSLLTRPDVIIVASVSCIYNIGSPQDYQSLQITLKKGEKRILGDLLRQLTLLQYERNDFDFFRGGLRVRGDIVEIFPPYEDATYKITFFDNVIEKITKHSFPTGDKIGEENEIAIFPAKHFLTPSDRNQLAIAEIKEDLKIRIEELRKQKKELFAERLRTRTNFDLEMIEETGYCNGIENYSRYFDRRKPGEPPYTLLDYFPPNFITIIDESHMTLPQIRGMYHGDFARKQTLIDFGFRLPSCLDNRPLKYSEFTKKINQVIFMSATPAKEEYQKSQQVVEQIIRPTGLLDPVIEIRKTENQIKDLIKEIQKRAASGQRALVTTLTIRMAEELTEYLSELGIKVAYLHHQINTLERPVILRNLRLGKYDVVVGINLLREGLDLPEVSLVAILDADKESFLRSEMSLIQMFGRAARHLEGKVIMYADRISQSMQKAIQETERRRRIQKAHNQKHHITPQSIKKAISEISEFEQAVQKPLLKEEKGFDITRIPREEKTHLIEELSAQMEMAAKNLEFERAALLRDQIAALKNSLKNH
jgi:excinuclease ABC subunit B